MTADPLPELRTASYHKSSHSGGTGDCVAVGRAGQWIGIQDTKQGPDGTILVFTHTAFAAFLTAVKAGGLR